MEPESTKTGLGEDSGKALYHSRISGPIEKYKPIERQPDGSFREKQYKVKDVVSTGLKTFNQAYDINLEGTHTSGRRGGLETSLSKGIEPFATPVNEGLVEEAAVVCGFVGNNESLVESETFKRDYGHIFDEGSEGYILVFDDSVTVTVGYEKIGLEAKIKRSLEPSEIKAIVVGNEQMLRKVTDEANKAGLSLTVILLERNQTRV